MEVEGVEEPGDGIDGEDVDGDGSDGVDGEDVGDGRPGVEVDPLVAHPASNAPTTIAPTIAP